MAVSGRDKIYSFVTPHLTSVYNRNRSKDPEPSASNQAVVYYPATNDALVNEPPPPHPRGPSNVSATGLSVDCSSNLSCGTTSGIGWWLAEVRRRFDALPRSSSSLGQDRHGIGHFSYHMILSFKLLLSKVNADPML